MLLSCTSETYGTLSAVVSLGEQRPLTVAVIEFRSPSQRPAVLAVACDPGATLA